ncbi:MAG TPA: hydroxyacylglutathione hydrolase [Polyangia bacterium]
MTDTGGTLGTLIIEPIACLKDNYAYLIRDSKSSDAYLVDPSVAEPCAAVLARDGLTLRGILATHHHVDHVGGIGDLVQRWGDSLQFVAGHAGDRGRIPEQTLFADAPADRFVATDRTVAGRTLIARHIPGHTRWAIAWGLAMPSEGAVPSDVFTGDTLFGAGCGRLFEGSPADMFASLRAFAELPETTRLWFGHEYTSSNLRFAAVVEPENQAVRARALETEAFPKAVTTPTTVGLERATNPFVRASSVEQLAERRAAKDKF